MKIFTTTLLAAQLGLFTLSQVGADGSNLPVGGMSMAVVEQQYGVPNVVRAPVGDPPIVVWEYDGFNVYFEHNLVLVAGRNESNATSQPDRQVINDNPDDGGDAPRARKNAVSDSGVAVSAVVPKTADVSTGPQSAEMLKASYQPTDNGDNGANAVPNVPTHGMNMQKVADLFGEPTIRSKAVGQPPIVVWTYPSFKVYFERDIVLVAAIEDSDPSSVIVGADEEGDLPETDPQR